MLQSSDFLALLTGLFQQMAEAPEEPPKFPPDYVSADSWQGLTLEAFRNALAAQQKGRHERQQEMSVRMRELSTLLEISQTFASQLALKPAVILAQLREIVPYTHAALFMLQGTSLVATALRAPAGQTEPLAGIIKLDSTRGSLNPNQLLRIGDITGSDPAAQRLRALLHDQTSALPVAARAWMWLPLAVNGQFIGGIAVAHTNPGQFTPHQAELALIVANQAAIALVNAQLHDQAQTVATLQERQRLAQNLHDAVNQSLFSANLIAEVLPRLWERDPEEGMRSLEDLRRLTRGAMAEMRGLLAELQPLVLTDTELSDLLRQLADAFTARTDIPVNLNVAGQGALTGDVQIAFYRVCQEALTNAGKHAAADLVTVSLAYQPGSVTLHIADNGSGFDPDHIRSGHYGLSIMHERAAAVGATLSISSRPGRGTQIAIVWRDQEQAP